LLAVAVPAASFVFSLGRPEGFREIDYIVDRLRKGSIWAMLITLGHLCLLVWWVSILTVAKKTKKRTVIQTDRSYPENITLPSRIPPSVQAAFILPSIRRS